MIKAVLILSLVAFAACGLVGGWSRVDVDDEEVREAAVHASESISKQFSSKYHHKFVKVLRAEAQIVAGKNFKLDLIVGLTDCKKSEVAHYQETENCNIQDKGVSTYKKCTVAIYRNLKGEHKVLPAGCILASRDEVY